jgi:hypothetical protein
MVGYGVGFRRVRVVSANQLEHNGSDDERGRRGARSSAEPDRPDRPEVPPESERPLFLHQPWMTGIVLVFAVAAIVAGLDNAVWLLIGSPFILALVLYVGVRLAARR